MNLAALFTSLAGPLVKKALMALGMGVVSYAAINAALTAVTSAVAGAYGGMSGDVAAIVSLAGFGQAMGIILGAFSARITYMSLNKIQVLAK